MAYLKDKMRHDEQKGHGFATGDYVVWYHSGDQVPAKVRKIGPQKVLIEANMLQGDKLRWVAPYMLTHQRLPLTRAVAAP